VPFYRFEIDVDAPPQVVAVSVPSASSVIPGGMFVFGIALTVGAFIPEAIKAKRLISDAVTNSAAGALPGTATIDSGR
jgi:hypothetical protein